MAFCHKLELYSREIFMVFFLSHHFSNSLCTAMFIHACIVLPFLCQIILCDVIGLANLYNRNIALETLCFSIALCSLSFFFHLLSSSVLIGCSNLSLYRMSCITPHTLGKKLRALLREFIDCSWVHMLV